MSILDIPQRQSELMHAWRRQIGSRARLATERGPRPFSVISPMVRGPLLDDRYVELRQLTLVALFDEWLPEGRLATRLVGVGGDVGPAGLQFGGPALSRFDKDLRLSPAQGGRGQRLDSAQGELLTLALQLERYLERCARHPYFPRRRVPLLPILPTDILGQDGCLVDLASLPKRRIIAIGSPERDLCGYVGTTTFDFYHSRFRVAS